MRASRPAAFLACLMPFLSLYSLFSLVFLPSATALQQDLVGKVDWHTALIGTPITYPPSAAPQAAGDVVFAITEKNVFAALDKNGEIRWRHKFPESDPLAGFYVDGNDVLLLSGSGASTARMFKGRSGTLRWEYHTPDDVSRPGDPAWVGTHATYSGDWVVVLSGGRRVTKLARKTGEQAWSWEFPPGGHSNTFTQIGVDAEKGKLIAIGFSTQFTAAAIYMVLDFEKVFPMTDIVMITSHTKYDNTLLVRRADGLGHAAVWAEFGRVRVTFIGLDGKETQTVDALPGEVQGDRYKRIIDVGTTADGYIVAELEGGGAALVEINEEARVVAFFENSKEMKRGAPVYAGRVGVDPAHKATFSQVAYSSADKAWVQSTLAVLRDGTTTTSINISSLGPDTVVRHIVIASSDGIPNLVYTTATGAVGMHCFQCTGPEALKWTRHEDLTNLAGVHFVDLGKPETEEALEVMEEETFIGRLARHIVELKDLPAFIFSTLTAKPALSASDVRSRSVEDELANLRRIVVAVTHHGQAFGISPDTGRIMWRSPLGFFSQDGADLKVSHVFVTRNSTEAGNPQVAVIADRTWNRRSATVGYHVDARTGVVAGDKHPDFDVPAGKELFGDRVKTAFLLPFTHCCTKNRVVAVVDESDQLHIFPRCKKIARAIEAMATSSRLFYSVLEHEVEGTALSGYAVGKLQDDLVFRTTQLWTRPFHAQVVLDVAPLTPAPTASYGRALGNKDVLYKYLNPHLEVVSTVSPLKNIGHITVLDTTTGTTIYEAEIPHVVGKNVHAAMVENWLVYTWLDAAPDSTPGWRLASVELYDNTRESAGASTMTDRPNVSVAEQTYILPTSVSALAFTTSKFGVAAKDLVYVNDEGQVAILSRRLLDPRRPMGKPTKADEEEMLVPYNPLIPYAPAAVVSHRYPLVGINRLTTAPTLLESTSLLFAYGTDLFCTAAIQPSGTFDILGSGFNKLQLLLTLAALTVGVVVAKPAVARKTLKEKWF